MASLRKFPESRFWYACYTDVDGSRVQKSTKQSDRKTAQVVADRYEKAAKLGSEKRLGEAQARKILADIYETVNKEPLQSSSTKEYLNAWTERRKIDTAARTAEAYAQIVRDFLASMGDRANLDISQITTKDVAKFRDAVLARTSVSTANKALKYLRIPLNAARKDGFTQDNPAARVDVIKRRDAAAKARRPFTLDEVKTIFSNAHGEWKGIILFGFYTGQRLRDIASLTWSNIDINARKLHFITRKTGRRMDLALHAELIAHIEGLSISDDPIAPLFPEAYKIASKAKADSRLSQQFHAILVASGFATARAADHRKEGNGRSGVRPVSQISFHSLRHTTTSLLKNSGVAELVARDLIGHDSEAVSRNYTHVDDASKRDAIGRLPLITPSKS